MSAIGRSAFGALAVLAFAASAVQAQAPRPDFLFKTPRASVTFKGGVAMPTAGSEIFDFTSEILTLGDSDYVSPTWGVDVAVRATDRLDIVVGSGVAHASTWSEFRDWVDLDDLPIEQNTRFTRVPFTVSLKYYLADRGRRISQFAWVPGSLAPYIGVGGGGMWYRYEQRGDFVDFDTLDIFFDILRSEGTTGVGHAFAGFDYSLGPRWMIQTEGRYTMASMRMTPDFVDFDDIDLGGFEITVGLGVRF